MDIGPNPSAIVCLEVMQGREQLSKTVLLLLPLPLPVDLAHCFLMRGGRATTTINGVGRQAAGSCSGGRSEPSSA